MCRNTAAEDVVLAFLGEKIDNKFKFSLVVPSEVRKSLELDRYPRKPLDVMIFRQNLSLRLGRTFCMLVTNISDMLFGTKRAKCKQRIVFLTVPGHGFQTEKFNNPKLHVRLVHLHSSPIS